MKTFSKAVARLKEPKANRQRGASAMESLLYLVVVAAIAVGIFALYTIVFGSTKVNTEKQYMSASVAAVKNMYGTNRNYGTGDITATLVSTKAVPSPLIVGNGLRNSWNGAVTVAGNNDTFTLTSAPCPGKSASNWRKSPSNRRPSA